MLIEIAEVVQNYRLDLVMLGAIFVGCVGYLAVRGELFRNW